MKKSWIVIAAAIPLVAIASIAVWKASGDDSRRQGALGTGEDVVLTWQGEYDATTEYAPGNVVMLEGSSYIAEGEKLSEPKPDCIDCGWTRMAVEDAGAETTKEEPTVPPLRGYEVVYKGASLPAGYTNNQTLTVSCPEGKVPLSGGAGNYSDVNVLWEGLHSMTSNAGVRTGTWGVRFEASPPLTDVKTVMIYVVCALAD